MTRSRRTLAMCCGLALAILTAAVPAVSGAFGAEAEGSVPGLETHVVEMLGDEDGYRFEPARVEVHPGDSLRFVMVSGGPHNVAFDADRIPDPMEARISENLPDRIQPLAGPLLSEPGAEYTFSTEGYAPGEYPYFCMPHVAMDMTGTIVVK